MSFDFMNKQTMLEILAEDIRYKKKYQEKYGGCCPLCNHSLRPGDTIIFLGDGNRICAECQEEIALYIESIDLEEEEENKHRPKIIKSKEPIPERGMSEPDSIPF